MPRGTSLFGKKLPKRGVPLGNLERGEHNLRKGKEDNITEILKLIAPGTPIRDGLEKINESIIFKCAKSSHNNKNTIRMAICANNTKNCFRLCFLIYKDCSLEKLGFFICLQLLPNCVKQIAETFIFAPFQGCFGERGRFAGEGKEEDLRGKENFW